MNWENIFHKFKPESSPEKTAVNPESKMVAAKTEKMPTDFNERLEDLQSAIVEMDSHKEEITENMFENIMGLPFDEFQNFINGGENIKEPDLKNLNQKISTILNGELNQISDSNRLRKFLNKPITKMSFVALCLFLKFSTPVVAEESQKQAMTDHKMNETELSMPDNLDSDPNKEGFNDKTYRVGSEEIITNELKEKAKINLTQGFEVDKAYIPENDAELIKNNVENFLNKLNAQNFEQYKDAKKIIYVSSDERATRYGDDDQKAAPKLENNIKLSTDRFTVARDLIKEVLEKHDYSSTNLTPEQINEIKQTNFEQVMPEKGYTKIIELNKINHQTGEKYTEADVQKMKLDDPGLYKKLNDECRYVKLDLMVESALKKIKQCDRILFFIDNSPSTERTMRDMADKLEEIGIKENSKGEIPKADLIYYTKDASPVKNLPNILEAAKDLRQAKTKGSSIENPFQSSINYFKNLIDQDQEVIKNGGEPEDYRAAIFTTDEGLQDAQNIFEATELAEKANVKNANIFLYSQNLDKPLEKNLFELRNELEQVIKAKMEFNIASLEQQKQDELQNLNQLISEANEKVNAKLLEECFGQASLDGAEDIKILIDDKNRASYLQKLTKHGSEKIILHRLFKSISSLEKVSQSLIGAQKQTFKDYVANTQIEIKAFTDKTGKKVDFDVLGYESLASNIKRESIKL